MSQYPTGSEYQGYPPPYPPNYPPPGANPPPPGGYGPPYPNPGYQPYYPGPMPPSTNSWALASLTCSLVGISILGVIFGHIALSEIKRSNGWQTGHGMALAGLIIGYAEIALAVLLFIVFFDLILNTARPPM